MRDNCDYRAANERAQAAVLQPCARLSLRHRGRFSHGSATGKGSIVPVTPPLVSATPWATTPQVSIPMVSMPFLWNGLVSKALPSIAYQWISNDRAVRRVGENDKRVRRSVHYNGCNQSDQQEVITIPRCVACGAELEPPVRAPHTVYVKTLYRIAGHVPESALH